VVALVKAELFETLAIVLNKAEEVLNTIADDLLELGHPGLNDNVIIDDVFRDLMRLESVTKEDLVLAGMTSVTILKGLAPGTRTARYLIGLSVHAYRKIKHGKESDELLLDDLADNTHHDANEHGPGSQEKYGICHNGFTISADLLALPCDHV